MPVDQGPDGTKSYATKRRPSFARGKSDDPSQGPGFERPRAELAPSEPGNLRLPVPEGDTRVDSNVVPPSAARYGRSWELFQRAAHVIPGSIHRSGRPLLTADSSPLYFERGEGAMIRDVDGHAYVDFFMAFGPFLLGYANVEVDVAAIHQLARGALLSMNHPMHIEFAETLVARFPAAEMAVFFKTGSEATTAALRIARQATGKNKVVRCGYHGWHDWCLPEDAYVPAGLRADVLEMDARDESSLARLLAANDGEVAAVIVAPEMIHVPSRGRLQRLIETTHAHGALFVLDEVKTGFRIAPGSIQQRYDLRPDITTLSKALGNGWPIGAVIGRRDVMRAGADIHYSATYHGETASMAAALKTMEILDREPVVEHVWRLGKRVIDGLNDVAATCGVPAIAYGEPLPPMPFLRFAHEDPTINAELVRTFYDEMLMRGILLHPRHVWFISWAHRDMHVDQLLRAAEAAMTRCGHLARTSVSSAKRRYAG